MTGYRSGSLTDPVEAQRVVAMVPPGVVLEPSSYERIHSASFAVPVVLHGKPLTLTISCPTAEIRPYSGIATTGERCVQPVIAAVPLPMMVGSATPSDPRV